MKGWTLDYLRALDQSDYETAMELYLEEIEATRKQQQNQ